MHRFALPVALYLSMAIAHAETQDGSTSQRTENKRAEVTLSRDDSVPQDCTAVLSIDEDKVATLNNGDSASLSLPAGSPYLRATLKEDPACSLQGLGSGQSLLLEPGKQLSFTLMYGNGALFFAPQHDQ
ncbi:hypothetical protein [Pseudomonas peli]|uniref:hypothetical protein n=1 Tax=Pseudomonas peli TaxID=592361 RepID=UPI003D31DE44